jgi:subtilase family serine protease
VSSFAVNQGSLDLQNGTIDFVNDTIKVRYVLASVTPTVGMTSMTGMTGAGTDQALASKTITNDTTNNRSVYAATSPVVNPSVPAGPAVGWLVLYKPVTTDADHRPIFVADVADQTPNGSNMPWTINAAGIAYTQQ